MNDFFKCTACARIVKVIQEGKGNLHCCGQPMHTLGGFQSVHGIFDFAIEKEAEAHDFYVDWAGRLEAVHLKELFLSFAAEEQKHKVTLERIKQGTAFLSSDAQVTDLKIVDYLVDISPSPGMDYQEALIIAMRREKSSIQLYTDLAAISGDDETKNIFLALAKEEAKHKLRMENVYEKDIYRDN